MSNSYEVMTIKDTLPCSQEDFDKLLSLVEKADASMQAELTPDGQIHLYAEESFFVPEGRDGKTLFKWIGAIAKKAGVPFVQFGVAFYSDKCSPESSGGYSFRVYADGKVVSPKVVWPEDQAWKCPECGKVQVVDYDSAAEVGTPRCCDGEVECERMEADEACKEGVH